MKRKILLVTGLVIGTLAMGELIGLTVLYSSVDRYHDYWNGRANQPGEFVYVAVGDSAAQGIGASQPQNGYVGKLARHIEQQTGRKVRLINLSLTGAKLDDALRNQIPKLADYDADLVTVEIGANDMGTYDKTGFGDSYEKLLQALPPGRSVVSDMPYFGTRPSRYNDNARQASSQIRNAATKYKVPVADLYAGLEPRQTPLIYASDFFHPNDRGYTIWYNAFRPKVDKVINN